MIKKSATLAEIFAARTGSPDTPAAEMDPSKYTEPFITFMTENPTVYHAVAYYANRLKRSGFTKLSERKSWEEKLVAGGKYFVERNGTTLIAFIIGKSWTPGKGLAIIAGHADSLTARLKPVSTLETKAGYVQLGVAPYAGGLNTTWLDRDLGIAGRVLVQKENGAIVSVPVKLGWPIARIPTLAPHFGAAAMPQHWNKETQMVPIIGLEEPDVLDCINTPVAPGKPRVTTQQVRDYMSTRACKEGSFTSTQPPRLVKAIAAEIGIYDYSSIVNWDLELFDFQAAQLGGIDKEFIFAGRIDDKLCSFAAMEALLACRDPSICTAETGSGIIKMAGIFDDEEIGSLLRQGAAGNFLPSIIQRICDVSPGHGPDILAQTYANSFLVSADVIHAVNPNFLEVYLAHHSPRLNVGVTISADANGHMTTDSISTALFQRIAEKAGCKLQVFQIRNDVRSGGTLGPPLSSNTGIRAIDVGCPQLSMHSIRATTGRLDPGLGVIMFHGFFEHFESVDKDFLRV
ncbi:MAG: hypothetical protein M1816_003671 [Peltula sp. TS41687]|nr:MAG: hypothetical protein M1816_003671 [Peltula sp. TS41687]